MQTKPAILQPFEVVIYGENKHAATFRVGVQAFSEDEAKASGLAQFRKAIDVTKGAPTISRIEVLSDVHLDLARKQQTLFEDLADLCVGHSLIDIQGACINLLLTAIQRRNLKLADAQTRWDELAGRGREALKRRYTGATDNRDAVAESQIAKRLIA